MVVDIAPQQQLPEIFNTNRNHHRSSSSISSSSSSIVKRNSSTTIETTSSSHTMTNGHRFMPNELGKKAEQILGLAPAVVDYCRQQSMDLSIQHPPRINITSQSRTNNQQVSPVTNSNHSMISKNRQLQTYEQLVPLIFKLVAPLTLTKFSETISRQSKHLDNIKENCQANLALDHETDINLSEDENDDEEEEEEDDDEKLPNENPIKNQHSDSDDEEASIRSNIKNEDETNETNLNTFSLSDFIFATQSPTESSNPPVKRSLPSTTPVEQTKPIKRKELIRSFSSFVNIPIDMKQPTLPITIPTYLFFDQCIQAEDNQPIEKSQRKSKRDINGSIKHEPNPDISDNSIAGNNTQQKKSKTSHVYKQEPAIVSTLTNIKTEAQSMSNFLSPNERPTMGNMATVAPMIVQPRKEKPTANVKPLLQMTSVDNASSTTNNSNVINTSDRLPTTTSSSTRANYANLKNMSKKELNSLAREKKKQADGEKRTFEDIKQSMSLYLESVCYFIQCAHNEPIVEQCTALLTATLAMLQHLAYNYQKMFHISTNPSAESLNYIRPKFLLIDYWLQSYIYHLQFNTNFSSIERCATQVVEYCNHSKSPEDMNSHTLLDFSKSMLPSYHSTYYWNKAERLTREEPSKKFLEQLLRQNQNRRLSRDDSTLDFLLYIFDAIDLLRSTTT
ncbi:hypothetical protein I4U23_012572 [Adineta vaga]|nr:hypothetical protein I4U23_012572 [Adineta vaga]